MFLDYALTHFAAEQPDLELRERSLDLPGVRLHIVEAGPSDGKPVLLLHGFPEFWWGWRRQIPALAAAGRGAEALPLVTGALKRGIALDPCLVRELEQCLAGLRTKAK